MAEIIRMPKMSDTMTEGVIAAWHKKVGDEVSSGDILAEVETDKATMDLESYDDGTLLYIGPKEKDAVPVDDVLAIIGEKGENIDDLLKEIKSGGGNGQQEEAPVKEEAASAPAEKIDTSGIEAELIPMPKMSDTMTEGTIVAWHKKVGDEISSGDIIAEIATDKATMDFEAPEEGVLLYTGPKEGEAIPVDDVLVVIGEKGADYETLIKAYKQEQAGGEEKQESAPAQEASASDKAAKPEPAKTPSAGSAPSTTEGGRVKASPLARKMAEEKGIDIRQVPGSGENGRIVKRDVENYQPSAAPAAASAESGEGVVLPPVVGEERSREEPVSQMRKTIAKRLAESKFTAPHFYLTMEINMDRAMEARKKLNEISPVKISFNDIVIKACAAALRKHPDVNTSWLGDKIRYNEHVHVGVAVAVDQGLLVPVLRFADSKALSHISAEVKELAKKAQSKKLQPQEMEGGTFAVSNLGMFGIEEFTAIINPPNACILAVGAIKQTPVVKDGQIVPGNVMKVTLSCDHRVVDGAVGSAFLKTLKAYLEEPVTILV